MTQDWMSDAAVAARAVAQEGRAPAGLAGSAASIPIATKRTGAATWTAYDEPGIGHLWYIAITERAPPPYRRQIHVDAIVDLDADGAVAGIEIIDWRMARPPAQGIEARRAETPLGGSVHESPVAAGDAPKGDKT